MNESLLKQVQSIGGCLINRTNKTNNNNNMISLAFMEDHTTTTATTTKNSYKRDGVDNNNSHSRHHHHYRNNHIHHPMIHWLMYDCPVTEIESLYIDRNYLMAGDVTTTTSSSSRTIIDSFHYDDAVVNKKQPRNNVIVEQFVHDLFHAICYNNNSYNNPSLSSSSLSIIRSLKLSNIEIPIECLIRFFGCNNNHHCSYTTNTNSNTNIQEFTLLADDDSMRRQKQNVILITNNNNNHHNHTNNNNSNNHKYIVRNQTNELVKAIIRNQSLETFQLLHDVKFRYILSSNNNNDNINYSSNSCQHIKVKDYSLIKYLVIPLLQNLRKHNKMISSLSSTSTILDNSKLKQCFFQATYFHILLELSSNTNSTKTANKNNNNNDDDDDDDDKISISHINKKYKQDKQLIGNCCNNGNKRFLKKVKISLESNNTTRTSSIRPNNNTYEHELNDILHELGNHTNMNELSIISPPSTTYLSSSETIVSMRQQYPINNDDDDDDDDDDDNDDNDDNDYLDIIHNSNNNNNYHNNNFEDTQQQDCIYSSFVNSLCQIIHSSLACPESLKLSGITFDSISFELLWYSLTNTKHLHDLTISYCTFHVGQDMIKRLMLQQKQNRSPLSSIHALSLEDNDCPTLTIGHIIGEEQDDDEGITTFTLMETLAIQLLQSPSSSLQQLRCTDFTIQAVTNIFQVIILQSNTCPLQILDLGTLWSNPFVLETKIDVLRKYIPQLQQNNNLRHLRFNLLSNNYYYTSPEIDNKQHNNSSQVLLSAFLQNSCLECIDMWETPTGIIMDAITTPTDNSKYNYNNKNPVSITDRIRNTTGHKVCADREKNNIDEPIITSNNKKSTNHKSSIQYIYNNNTNNNTMNHSIIRLCLDDVCERNKTLKQWKADPECIPSSLWSHLFEATLDLNDNYSIIFHELMSLQNFSGWHTIKE